MSYLNEGIYFDEKLQKEIKEKFYYVDEDPEKGKRLFFENSGGSLRLKESVQAREKLEAYPDCPERNHYRAKFLKDFQAQGTKDIMEVIFGAKSGALITELTASQTMFQMVETVLENAEGSNAVVTELEHPSAYDSVKCFCEKTGKEFRVVPANKKNGGIDVGEILKKVDKNTCLLNIIYASNISGAIMDLETIVHAVREINPDIYIITDAVQHVPHGIVDVEKLKLDGVNFAPYKFFGTRGSGFAYVSDRIAKLPHRKILGKSAVDWELGSPAPSNFAAITEVVNYVCWLGSNFTEETDRRELFKNGMKRIHLQERALLNRMLNGTEEVQGLRNISGVQVYVDTEELTNRDLIIAMGIDGLDPEQCVIEYQKLGVTVYDRVNTSIFSKRIVEAIGLTGAVRVSPLHCHDAKDIDEFLKITKEIAETFAGK